MNTDDVDSPWIARFLRDEFIVFLQSASTQFMNAAFRERRHLVSTHMSSSQEEVAKW